MVSFVRAEQALLPQSLALVMHVMPFASQRQTARHFLTDAISLQMKPGAHWEPPTQSWSSTPVRVAPAHAQSTWSMFATTMQARPVGQPDVPAATACARGSQANVHVW